MNDGYTKLTDGYGSTDKTIVVSFKCDERFATELKRLAETGGTSVAEAIRGSVIKGAREWVKEQRQKQKEAAAGLQVIPVNTNTDE